MELDIVIPLGRYSKCTDNELKYALRGIENNLSGCGKIFIIGYAPKFLNDTDRVVVIKKEDSTLEKEYNIFQKIIMACEDDFISDPFMVTNDDIFFKEKMCVSDIKYWFHGELKTVFTLAQGLYKNSVLNTMNFLSSNGRPSKHFDVHTPILYEKEKFMKLLQYDWHKNYTIKSMYCNINRITGEPMRDLNLNRHLTKERIYQAIKDRKIFAYNGTDGMSAAMIEVLEELYPNKSSFEK